jgi:hypothetical protein
VRRAALAAASAVLAGTAMAGCTGTGGAAPPRATGAPSSGRYPVATPQPQVTGTPTATPGGYQLVAAGDPVRVVLAGADLLAQVSGPEVTLPEPTPGQPVTAHSAPGVLTVSLTATSGRLEVPASSFLGLDERQDPIALQPDAAAVSVSPGHPATLHLSSEFDAGHTTLTWQPEGRPLVTWDFVVEID